MEDNGRQGEMSRESGHTIQHRHTCGETMGDKTSGRPTHRPSNTSTHVGRHWETKGDKTLGRRTHHPTKGNKKGYNGRQRETRPWEDGHTIQHQGGHLKKVLRTPNSTLFGEKNVKQLSLSQTKGNSPQVSGQKSNLKKQLLLPFHIPVSEPYSPWW